MIQGKDILNMFGIEDVIDLPEAVMRLIEGDSEKRTEVYKEMLKLADFDLSYDWFQQIYEDELSQRRQKKQDFTPNSIGVIAAKLCGLQQRSVYEPTAGNGSMLIADWNAKMQQQLPWQFFPSKNIFECWELSDRSIPILLFNLSIRGMMGVVYHGDVLERKIKQKYILLNRKDDALAFSEIHKVNDNDIISEL